MNFEKWFDLQFPKSAPPSGVQAVVKLAAEGATVPFIARYRKEQTGNLNEVVIQNILEAKEKWDQVLDRQKFILGEIEKQGKLTEALKSSVTSAFSMTELDDLYLPYKIKRKTKAGMAREAGLEPLADWIWNCGHGTETPLEGQTLDVWALSFHNAAAGITDAKLAIDGAQDILVEKISEIQSLRQTTREVVFKTGSVHAGKAAGAKPNSKYENYFDHHEAISQLQNPKNSHRYLAMRRGWMEEELTLAVGGPWSAVDNKQEESWEADLLKRYQAEACSVQDSPGAEILLKAARLALKAHVLPSIDNEVHKALKEVADHAAIEVFAENVRKLLLAAPYGSKAVLGVDPGLRTGCKLAVVDQAGKYIASGVIHLQSESDKEKALVLIPEIVKTGEIQAVAVGNGTAGRETEVFIRSALKKAAVNVPVVMVSEAGASVYSASEIAREEFPDLDLTVRGAISIARRLQDPLAELVKVDPKSIGVGQYQHDVSPVQLKRSLDGVVDSCVNQVGVNLNTASEHLLAHVSGIGPSLAKAIVSRRSEKGLFKNRSELMGVSRFSEKVFELAAGFLRIPDAENPLDNTGVHPERYPHLEKLAARLKKSVGDFVGSGVRWLKEDKSFAAEIGEFTFKDILAELEKPGCDPRDAFEVFQFRDDIHEVKDLKPDLLCPGIVTNVTNFGAFVDIGVHQDGLVHISQLSDRYVQDPREVVSPGDHVQVKVLEVNFEKNQISLSMKVGQKKEQVARPASRPHHEPRSESRSPIRPNGERRPDFRNKPASSAVTPVIVPKSGASSKPGGNRPVLAVRPTFKNNPFAALAGLKMPKSDKS